MSTSESDRAFLHATLELAEGGLFSATPNPRVACILVRQGRVVGRGFHHRSGAGHAEIEALQSATAEDVRGATAYVSLEPCNFQGRTGACSQALIKAGIGRVMCALEDPHPEVSGSGLQALRTAGIDARVSEDPQIRRKARDLNCGYLRRITAGLPWVRLKAAASLDGRTAMASGESRWITGAPARSDVQYWRARSCAIVTGIGTVLADDPRLSVREERFEVDGVLRQPLKVVLDHRLRMDPAAHIFSGLTNSRQTGVLIVTQCRDASLLQRFDRPGVEIYHPRGEKIEALEVLHKLAGMECNEVLVEAGPAVMGHFLTQNLWQEALIYLAPKIMGSSARPLVDAVFDSMQETPEYTFAEAKVLGEDLRLRLTRERRELC